MSDYGDLCRDVREYNRKKKEKRRIFSLKSLRDAGIEYQDIGSALRIGDFDFWPTTGAFFNRKTRESNCGVKELIKIIKNEQK